MTRNLLCAFSIVLFSTASLLSQITISSSHMPTSGDTIRYSLANPTSSIDFMSAGANQSWDFSTLKAISQGLNEYKSATKVNLSYFLFFGPTAYGLKIFDTINLGTMNLVDGYDFYKNSSSAFKSIGRGMELSSVPSPSFFTDDDEIYQFPLQFGDRDSSTFRVKNDLAGIVSFIQKGYRINEVEGWGIVKTPFGTYSALKVKTTIHESDSIVVSGISLPSVPRTTIEYKWLATEERMPVFEVSGNDLAGNFTVTYIRYRDKGHKLNTGITSSQENKELSIQHKGEGSYSIRWKHTTSKESLSLIDANGRLIEGHISGNDGQYAVDLTNLNSGIYLLYISTPTFSEVVKLVKP